MPVVPTTSIFKDDILKGKVAFVTGGGSGICKGMAEALARHGAKVTIFSRTLSKLEAAAKEMRASTGGEIFAVAGDVRDPKQVQAAVDQHMAHYGRLDILVNGAAGNFLSLTQHLSFNAFRSVIEIDLIGTFNTTRVCFPHLKASKGSIINVTATLQFNGQVFQAHACAAKAGIDAMSLVWANEWGPLGIRSNCIAPGPIANTVGMAKLSPGDAEGDSVRIPIGRMGEIRDIEHATLYLASEAGSFVTGQTLVVDGGNWLQPSMANGYPEICAQELNMRAIMEAKL
ncbi:2,4-dienoyl-CoA reductase [(3E)-enoyl-CoA-producing], peroxisomal [Entomortierella parvispora]|uniref:2,4-dienoyl-CoA reductase [(3E)-enoyl-CoA-producing] n=1 Tax=Entomortierella parvispora TaxID=205924 RepID=A0A9P3H5U2_9FUNG|nr:2,4-dienoyl-CoA reductase [(3E)-enoyl-CoA-producing], peroxisomal [Entomortierella parvispora]